MSVVSRVTDTFVCHCFEVTEEQIRLLIDAVELQTVEEVSSHTGAGTGCTACRYRILRMLAGQPFTCGLADPCDRCGTCGGQCNCQVD